MRSTIVLNILLVMMLGAVGCRRVPDYSEMDEARKLDTCFWRILDGHGAEALGPNGEDSFALLQEMLLHPDREMRGFVANDLALHTWGGGHLYGYALDGYLDAGRDKELQKSLYQAWKKNTRRGAVRADIAEAYLDLQRRQYLWAHPEIAEQLALMQNLPFSPMEAPKRGWKDNFNAEQRKFVNRKLIQLGDEEFLEVLTNGREGVLRESQENR